MRIAIAQLSYTIGAFEANLERMIRAVAEARTDGAELVVFSELATTAYPPGDLLDREDFVARSTAQLEQVAALSDEDLGILVGCVDRNSSGQGKRLVNAAALCHRGRVIDRYVKCLLPTYDVFDEARYFEPGTQARPLLFRGVRLGVTICEDLWAEADPWTGQRYGRDPVAELVAHGAEVLINLSASPFTLGKAAVRRAMAGKDAAEHGRYFVYVNQVGAHEELVFDGHSLIFDPSGRQVVRARDFSEDLLIYDVPVPDAGGVGELGTIRPVAGSRIEEAYAALVLGTRDYLHKTGFERVVLGLSGGIDSALTAAIAAEAVGPECVLGVALPSRYSSQGSLDDAAALAANLGIEHRVIPIDQIFQAFLDSLAPSFKGIKPDVTEENLQARARGTVLMALSNKEHRLLLATGNKSELAVGYCTLYGDMCGGLAVIGDVPKTLVYQLAGWVNRDEERIPRSTMVKPPSAELRPDQTDQDSLPPYEVLDRVVEGYVEQCRSVDEMVAAGLDRDAVEQVVRLINRSEHKRRQAAPAIKISAKAFGSGRRYPIVADYGALSGSGRG